MIPLIDDVLAARDLGVEARAELDEGGDPPVHREAAAGGLGDAGHELQQGRLAGAVLADDAEGRALRHLEGDAVERGERLLRPQVGEHAAGEERALQRPELVAVGVKRR